MLISEFLPNPAGKDTEGEWIKLFNDGQEMVDLAGWQIKDASGKTFTLKNQRIGPSEYLTLDYKTTKIALNNNGETLFLYDQDGRLVDKADFTGNASEDKILIRQGDKFIFTAKATAGETNAISNNVDGLTQKNSQEIFSANVIDNVSPDDSSVINYKTSLGFNGFLIGFFLALSLAFLSVTILKKVVSLPE